MQAALRRRSAECPAPRLACCVFEIAGRMRLEDGGAGERKRSHLGKPRGCRLNEHMLLRRVQTLCTLLALTGGSAAGLAQTAGGPDYWAVTGVRPNDALNMRMAPNADSEAILRIPHNARGLKNYGCPNDVTFEQWKRMTPGQRDQAARSRWCQVEYQGRKGWVAGRFLREDSGTAR
jgi:hypothetical protein